MNWEALFSNIIQPTLFFGLFVMTFISMMIAIRAEKREIKRNEENIVKNAKMIERNYKLLKKAVEGHLEVVKGEVNDEEDNS